MNAINEYDDSNIDSLVIPKTDIGDLVKDYIVPIIKHGSKFYIKNADTKVILLKINDYLIPVSVTENHQYGSYIFSFYTAFHHCIIEELTNCINNKIKLYAMIMFVRIFSVLMKVAKINKCVIINNWLFSTNLHPNVPNNVLEMVTDHLRRHYTGYTIIVKSLNTLTTRNAIKSYLKQKFHFMPLRPIYLLTPQTYAQLNKKKRRELRNDNQYIVDNDLILTYESHIIQHDHTCIKEFYDDLYIKKYSQYNTQFTDKFFEDRLQSNCFKKLFILKNHEICAFALCFSVENILSTPILGYAKNAPDLYRVTSYCIQQYAMKNVMIDHASSGVGYFKQSRGYEAYTEYMGFQPDSCVNYLNLLVWRMIAWIVKRFFVPMAKKNKFL